MNCKFIFLQLSVRKFVTDVCGVAEISTFGFDHGQHGEMVSSLHVKFPIRGCPVFLLKGLSVCRYAARA
jgi:hypothetical protein